MLWHAGVPGVRSGYIGVDVFFVLSGFLITGLLVGEAERSDRIDLLGFYRRRIRRLLPGMALTLVVTGLALRFLAPATRWSGAAGDMLASTFYVENWRLASSAVSYIDENAPPSAMQHYWSLSVEEQFYLVWPWLVAGVAVVARRRRRGALAALLAAAFVASFGWSLWLTGEAPDRAYFVTTTRVWQLAAGAILSIGAHLVRRIPEASKAATAYAGLVLIGASALFIPVDASYPGWWAALPTLGAAAVVTGGIGAAGHSGAGGVAAMPRRLLESRPLVFLGDYSYALYLWHWPILVVFQARYGEQRWPVLLGLVVAAVPLSVATTRGFENPIRFRPEFRGSWSAAGIFVVSSVTVVSIAWGLSSSLPAFGDERANHRVVVESVLADGANRLVADSAFGALVLNPDGSEAVAVQSPLSPPPELARADRPELLGCFDLSVDTEPCVAGDPDGDTTLAILGDSLMEQWLDAFDVVASDRGWRLEILAMGGCPFVDVSVVTSGGADRCDDANEFRRRWLAINHPDVIVVSAGDRGVVDDGEILGSAESREALTESQGRALADLVARDSVIVVLAPTPSTGSVAVDECLLTSPEPDTCSFSPILPTTLLHAAYDTEGIVIIDLNEAICPKPRCPPTIGSTVVYRDVSHLTNTYALSLAPLLAAALDPVVTS